MIVGVLTESHPGERRVALTPSTITQLQKKGVSVLVQSGAGLAAGFRDQQFEQHGAKLAASRGDVLGGADVLVQVSGFGITGLTDADRAMLRPGQVVVGMQDPLGPAKQLRELASTGIRLFALELIPRITRAQSIDVLSSMATLAGYKAVLLAAVELSRMFPLLMTAAGTLQPARVLVIGAGVAGLQACATARRLGAVVQAYDVRPSVKDQVVSVGAKFLELELAADAPEDKSGYAREQSPEFLERQRELMHRVVSHSDVVITTAAIPGKPAPKLVTAPMVEAMNPGSVIVDLAAERGGNCELTRAGERVDVHGVTLLGPLNLAASVPFHASQMYAKNIATFLDLLLGKDGQLQINLEDQIVRDTLVCDGGQITNDRIRALLGESPSPQQS